MDLHHDRDRAAMAAGLLTRCAGAPQGAEQLTLV